MSRSPHLLPYSLCWRVQIQVPLAALVHGNETLLGHKAWGLPRTTFMWKKEELVITKHIYPIKVGWVTRQESPSSTKQSQLGSQLAKEVLAREREKLTGSHSENKTTSLKQSRERGMVLEELRPRRPQEPEVSEGWFRACPRNDHGRAGWTHRGGCEEKQEKANDSLWKWFCFQVSSQDRESHQGFRGFSLKRPFLLGGGQETGSSIYQERSFSTEIWFNHQELPLPNPCIPKDEK